MKTGRIWQFEFLRIKARNLFHNYSLPRWFVFALDAVAVFVTFIFSYILRYNFEPFAFDLGLALNQSILVVGIYCSFELIFRSFAGLIRHTTIKDVFNVVLSTTSSFLVLLLLTYLSRSFGLKEIFNLPLSVIIIHYVSLNVVLFVVRIVIKMFFELVSTTAICRSNIIIFGAGSMGVLVKRVIDTDQSNDYNIVAFLDSNIRLQKKNLCGIPVYSPKKLKKEFLAKYNIRTMIFGIMNYPSSEKSDIFRFAVDMGLEVLEVPAVNSWLNGQFQLNQLKKINIEDLLGRDPIQLNMKIIEKGLREKTILVTGAAGSIGSEIVRQLTRFSVGKLVLIDNAETPMFHFENELREKFPHAPVRTILADVTDEMKMDRIFKNCRPEIIFHAAAYKHVPLMEENPDEAIRVNVGSTTLLTQLSIRYGIEKFVLVSTDKAVNPTNVMGASKRMCEMILRSRSLTSGNRTSFVITRFGNVLGSNGSVIPRFRNQIEAGGPVTVTHPDITRFFMTIPEAGQLVLEAGFMGMGGEIFVFDMGEPVKIVDLARRMIRLSGCVPDLDIQIEYTGLRPGEKLFEELLANKEKTLPTYNPKVKVAEVDRLDYGDILSEVHKLQYSYGSMTESELVNRILRIVPEFKSKNERYTVNQDGSGASQLEVFPD